MLTLRPDQEEALEAVRAHLRRGRKRVLLQAPTGFGKTVVASTMAKTAVEKGRRVWMLVHRVSYVDTVTKRHYVWASDQIEQRMKRGESIGVRPNQKTARYELRKAA